VHPVTLEGRRDPEELRRQAQRARRGRARGPYAIIRRRAASALLPRMEPEENRPTDLQEILAILGSTDVVVIGFSIFPERLVVDFRSNRAEAPLVKLMEPLNSWVERIRRLMTLRPSLGRPQTRVFFIWPHSVTALVNSGIWERLAERCTAARDDCADAVKEALRQLYLREREGLVEAIRGERYETLWRRA